MELLLKFFFVKYLFIAGTLIFTVFGQIILKWRINQKAGIPENTTILSLVQYFTKLLMDPYIIAGFASAFIASLFWMLAMTKFEITIAYPFMSLAPALVFLIGVVFLGENFTIGKLIGLFIIILGVIVTVKI